MSKLEKRLREVAERGEFSYLAVVPVAGKGPNDIVFVATYSPASRFGNSVARNADPVVAILEALNGEPPVEPLVKPIARKREPDPLEPWDV